MGSSQSCGTCLLEKNENTKSRSYVEELLQIKHANYLNLHSMESKEVLQSRRERVMKILTERKPAKPYALQLLEARAAAKSELSISDESKVDANAQSSNVPSKNTTEPDQRSRILQRIAARRKSKQPASNSPSTSVETASSTINPLSSPVVNNTVIKTTVSASVNICSPPFSHDLAPPAANKATQSDPPASVLSTASQSSSLSSTVDSAIQVTPVVQSSPQQTVRLSEPKMYVQPPTPVPKIFIPPPPRLLNQPPLTARQSISAAFSKPPPCTTVESRIAPSPPSFCHLIENVYKDKWNKNKLLMEEKRRSSDKDSGTSLQLLIKSVASKQLLPHKEEQPLEIDSDDSCGRRHTAVVDKLTDSFMANWDRKTSAELLGADEKELSLLTYGGSKGNVVPHYPIRRDIDLVSRGLTKDGGVFVSNESLPSIRFGKTRHFCEARREIRCMRHQVNKV